MADFTYYEVGSWSHGFARGGHYFWISDIDAMLQKLAKYEHNIHSRLPGAQLALQDFKGQQKEMVASICKVSSLHPTVPYGIILKTHAIPIQSINERERWYDRFATQRHNDEQVTINQRFES
jgi:hypothetical protein